MNSEKKIVVDFKLKLNEKQNPSKYPWPPPPPKKKKKNTKKKILESHGKQHDRHKGK